MPTNCQHFPQKQKAKVISIMLTSNFQCFLHKRKTCDFEIENFKIGNQLFKDSVEPPMLNSYSAKQLFRKELILQYTSCLIVASNINVQVSKTYKQNNFLTQEKQFQRNHTELFQKKGPL